MSDYLRLHGLQHARPPCPSPTPRACSNSAIEYPVMPSNHLILWCPLLLLPSIFPSIRGFSHEPVLRIRWPKYWSVRGNIEKSCMQISQEVGKLVLHFSSITKVYIQVSYYLIFLLGEAILKHTTRATSSIQEAVQKKCACSGIPVMPHSV